MLSGISANLSSLNETCSGHVEEWVSGFPKGVSGFPSELAAPKVVYELAVPRLVIPPLKKKLLKL